MNILRRTIVFFIISLALLDYKPAASAQDAPTPFEIHQEPAYYSLIKPEFRVQPGFSVKINESSWQFTHDTASVSIGNFLCQYNIYGRRIEGKRFIDKIEARFWLCPAILGYGYKKITESTIPDPDANLFNENKKGPYLIEGGWTSVVIKNINLLGAQEGQVFLYQVPAQNTLIQGENGPHIFTYELETPLEAPPALFASMEVEVMPGMDVENTMSVEYREQETDMFSFPGKEYAVQLMDRKTLAPLAQKKFFIKENGNGKEVEMLSDKSGIIRLPEELFTDEKTRALSGPLAIRDPEEVYATQESFLGQKVPVCAVIFLRKQAIALSAEIIGVHLERKAVPETVADVMVYTEGPGAARDVQLELTHNKTGLRYAAFTIPVLEARSEKIVQMRFPASKIINGEKTVTLRLTAHAANNGREVDMLDNNAVKTISFLSDLAVEPHSIKTIPEGITQNEPFKIKFNVYNNSNMPLMNTTAATVGMMDGAGKKVILTQFDIPQLLEHESKTITTPDIMLESSGETKLFIELDNLSSIQESNKENNMEFFTVNAIDNPLPDLEVTSDDVSFSPREVRIGQPDKISIKIRNVGSADAACPVSLYIDKVKVAEESVAIRKRGEAALAPKVWFPSKAGTVEVAVFIDESNEIKEATRRNNSVSKTVEVQDVALPDFAKNAAAPASVLYPKNVDTGSGPVPLVYCNIDKAEYIRWDFDMSQLPARSPQEKLLVYFLPLLFDNDLSSTATIGTFSLENHEGSAPRVIAENIKISDENPIELPLDEKQVKDLKTFSVRLVFKNEHGNKIFFASTKNLLIRIEGKATQ